MVLGRAIDVMVLAKTLGCLLRKGGVKEIREPGGIADKL